jgi:hypothetical protein
MTALPGFILVCVLTILAFVTQSMLRIVEHVLEDEIKARLPHSALKKLEEALNVLPVELRDDRRQAWEPELVHLETQPLAAVWFAHQCLRAAKTEAKELAPQPVTAGLGDSSDARDLGVRKTMQKMRNPSEETKACIRAGIGNIFKD